MSTTEGNNNTEEKYMQNRGGPRKAYWMSKEAKKFWKYNFWDCPNWQCSFTKVLSCVGSPKHEAKIKGGKETQGIRIYTSTQKVFWKTRKILLCHKLRFNKDGRIKYLKISELQKLWFGHNASHIISEF